MKLYSYVVARDFGFAPNPFYNYCTLATCKPNIRRSAIVGDWVVGTGSARNREANRLVYAMKVTTTVTFDEYWNDPRFIPKRPNLHGSLKQAYGDNIYHRDPATGRWIQENSHHSLANGRSNRKNIRNDTQTDRVLISSDFVYWGKSSPAVPAWVRRQNLFKKGPGHRCDFSEEFVRRFADWLRSLGQQGYVDDPRAFPSHA